MILFEWIGEWFFGSYEKEIDNLRQHIATQAVIISDLEDRRDELSKSVATLRHRVDEACEQNDRICCALQKLRGEHDTLLKASAGLMAVMDDFRNPMIDARRTMRTLINRLTPPKENP